MNPNSAPDSIFTVEADQWLEHGYVLRGNQVMSYETDRKEQTYMEFGSQPAAEFIADENNPPEVRDWVRSRLNDPG